MAKSPGVYIKEIPSGVRPISGVSTSNTAFICPCKKGPLNQAVRITSYGAFERIFGGLFAPSEASYAIQHYFLNGGSVAFIVRVSSASAAAVAAIQNQANTATALIIEASSEGAWGNNITAGIAVVTGVTDTFTLLIREYVNGRVVAEEAFIDLSTLETSPRYAQVVVNRDSELVTLTQTAGQLPAVTSILIDATITPILTLDALTELTQVSFAPLVNGEDGIFNGVNTAAIIQGTADLSVGINFNAGNATFTFNGFDVVVNQDATGDLSGDDSPNTAEDNLFAIQAAIDVVTDSEGDFIVSIDPVDNTLIITSSATGSGATIDITAGNDALGLIVGDAQGTGWADVASSILRGSEAQGTGIYALNAIVPDVFNLLCIPDAVTLDVTIDAQRSSMIEIYQEANTFCRNNYAFLLIDIPQGLNRTNVIADWISQLDSARSKNAAANYPRLTGPDGLNPSALRSMANSGAVAGLYARTDATRGVWKTPAGTDARIAGGSPEEILTDLQHGPLNIAGLNVLRVFPVYGNIAFGGRTLDGADDRASEWKYLSVRRLALFIEASLQRGMQWVVFEPNDEPLWGQIRLNVGSFMNQLHRQGAFQGASARDAYLVKCDSETTTQADINLGVVNVLVAFAPLKPAEFVVISLQLSAQATA